MSSSESEEYEVKQILNRKVTKQRDGNKHIYYLVHWKGYSISEATWEPSENLQNALQKVQNFERKRWENSNNNSQQMETNFGHIGQFEQEQQSESRLPKKKKIQVKPQQKQRKRRLKKVSQKIPQNQQQKKQQEPRKDSIRHKRTQQTKQQKKHKQKKQPLQITDPKYNFPCQFKIIGAKKQNIKFYIQLSNGQIRLVNSTILQAINPNKIIQFYQKHIFVPDEKNNYQSQKLM